MKKIFSVFCLMIGVVMAQSNDTVRTEIPISQSLLADLNGNSRIAGTAIDVISKKPLGNVRIEVLGTTNSAVTGSDGQFQIDIPTGYYQVQASAKGYRTEVKSNIRVKNNDETEIFFSLRMDDNDPPDFVPVDKHPQPLPGKSPSPKYPELGRKIKMEGMVWIKFLVNEEGNVTKADVIREEFTRSDSLGLLNKFTPSEEKRISDETYKAKYQFEEAAKEAGLQWKFTPAVMAGQNVKVWVSIPFKFKLDSGKKPSEEYSPKKKE